MDKLAARKWVDTLRSGKYAQAQGQLGYVDEDENRSYCCLGVFCDMVLAENEGVIQEVTFDHYIAFDTIGGGRETGVLPKAVAEKYDFPSVHPEYTFSVIAYDDMFDEDGLMKQPYDRRGVEVELSLPALNDSGFTFSQIADIIEWVELSNG